MSALPPPLTASSLLVRSVRPTARKKEARFTLLKREGNDLVKQGNFDGALHKYSECLALKPDECALYTNRCAAFKDAIAFHRALPTYSSVFACVFFLTQSHLLPETGAFPGGQR